MFLYLYIYILFAKKLSCIEFIKQFCKKQITLNFALDAMSLKMEIYDKFFYIDF